MGHSWAFATRHFCGCCEDGNHFNKIHLHSTTLQNTLGHCQASTLGVLPLLGTGEGEMSKKGTGH